MESAQLFFLSDEYYLDFPDDRLMKNKETVEGRPHKRPCFFAFKDQKEPEIYWIVPLSSRTKKYREISQKMEKKYGTCDTIRFGTVLGRDTAFLIQNMCPATQRYLTAYKDKNDRPIRINDNTAGDVQKHAHAVLEKVSCGVKLIFPDVFKIYNELLQEIQQGETE